MVVDYYSRYFEVVVMRSTTSHKVIVALMEMFARYGFPHSLKSDNGPQFVSDKFETFLQTCGIEHIKNPLHCGLKPMVRWNDRIVLY